MPTTLLTTKEWLRILQCAGFFIQDVDRYELEVTELPVFIAKQAGKAYAIEPNCNRNDLLVKNSSESEVKIRQGSAENIPFEDNRFDAVVALWILRYVDDLEGSLREMSGRPLCRECADCDPARRTG
ncbi:hypothetical protein PWT90_04775 [Aphanocladium album]|nr:hypothetical protein PWT90_04775 [Aphanocladium album]